MKVIKPQRLGVLTRVFEHRNECRMAVAVLVFFPMAQPHAVLSEVAMWKLVPGELGPDGVLDAGMPKSRGEFVLTAKAFAPGGTPVTQLGVRARVGSLDKTVHVHGDRRWTSVMATAAEPFTEMPLTWSRAYGGEGYAPNPVGKGFAPVDTPAGRLHPLPNVEDPRHPVKTRTDRMAPVGFAALDIAWPQRASKAGTYDQRWLEERFPGLADDIDWTMFNTVQDDQQLRGGYFEGGETYRLENMHPTQPVMEGMVPRLSARVFATLRAPGTPSLTEVPMRLETVHLIPHAERGVVIYRGVIPVAEDDGDDVLHLVAALERPNAPRAVEHYAAVLARRLDRTTGHLEGLRDQDLLPDLPTFAAARPAEQDDTAALVQSDGLMRRNLRRKLEAAHAEVRAQVAAAGLDPDVHVVPLPPDPPPPELSELPAVMASAHAEIEAAKASVKVQQAEAEATIRAVCAAHGLSYDDLMASQRRRAGPPPLDADAELARMRAVAANARSMGSPQEALEAQTEDPSLLEKLREASAALRESYRRGAHLLGEPRDPGVDEPRALRARVETLRAAGESLAGLDLSYADLSGMDLRGAALRGAMLERADLSGARLDGADLSMAVLARAVLRGASLDGARMQGANLGHAVLADAHGEGVDLTVAVLQGADLTAAVLHNASLVRADLTDARTEGMDLTGARAAGMKFLGGSLAGVRLAGADLTRAVFIETDLRATDFTGATLTGASFVTVRAEGAVFRGAHCGKVVFVKDCVCPRAVFADADMPTANLRGTDLTGADFTGARMQGADLSLCVLRGARLDGVDATEARFVRADLTDASVLRADFMLAILQKATITQSVWDGSNMFRADMARVRGGSRSTRGANLKGVRVLPRSR